MTLQAFWLILGETRLECHTFLAKSMKKFDTPSVLLFFFAEKSLFYLSETPLFPTPAPDPADPPDPPDPGKMVPEPALRPSLPHELEVRMT